jgi:hypothetical protein
MNVKLGPVPQRAIDLASPPSNCRVESVPARQTQSRDREGL